MMGQTLVNTSPQDIWRQWIEVWIGYCQSGMGRLSPWHEIRSRSIDTKEERPYALRPSYVDDRA